MNSFKSHLVEALDKPYPVKLNDLGGAVEAEITMTDANNRSMYLAAWKFHSVDPRFWVVEFSVGGEQRATGAGNQFRVFATAQEFVKQLISKKKPQGIVFSADKKKDPSSRQKLYDRFAKMLANKLRWDLRVDDQAGERLYYISNPTTFDNLDELYKPQAVTDIRRSVRGVTSVDTRDTSWMTSVSAIMKDNGFTKLGSGKYASVFGHPRLNYIIKIFMKDAAFIRWVKFAQMNRHNPYVPKLRGKVVKFSDMIYAVRMERLSPASGLTGPFAKAYNQYMRGNVWVTGNRDIDDILSFFDQGDNKKLLDLHGENVMMRGDQLVIIDPFYNWFNKHKPMAYTIDPDDVDASVF